MGASPVAGTDYDLGHGDVVIAAITSCTNTSNPAVMLGAGLVAKKAVERGLSVKPWVKTSLAPGSKVVTEYLAATGLQAYLDRIGFNLVGYGCTTCIGNSGPLPEPVSDAIRDGDLVVASVLSGNRNFEGRVHQEVRTNWLASPPLVVAYALAGTTRINLEAEPIDQDSDGNDIYLRDIWPSNVEIQDAVAQVSPAMFDRQYADVFTGPEAWQGIEVDEAATYGWENSTYIKEPPFFSAGGDLDQSVEVTGARILALLGDSVTTDHISPAGAIQPASPAGEYLQQHGVHVAQFNSYGSRRGNHEVMMRGTFGNIRIRNEMTPEREGGYTRHIPTGDELAIYDAAMRYQGAGVPLVVFAGKEYGTGSSRDWAAKGTRLLNVKAVIAESFERIHRSKPDRHGDPAARVPTRREPRVARPQRGRDRRYRPAGRCPRRLATTGTDAENPTGRRYVRRDRRALLPRYGNRDRLFQVRRHPAVRSEPASRSGVATRTPRPRNAVWVC